MYQEVKPNIVSLTIMPVHGYYEMYNRPFEMNVTGSVQEGLARCVNNDGMFEPSLVAKIAPEVVDIGAPEVDGSPIWMPHGANNVRLTYQLIVDTDMGNGIVKRTHFSGYSSHYDPAISHRSVSSSEDIAKLIDPRTILYINSSTTVDHTDNNYRMDSQESYLTKLGGDVSSRHTLTPADAYISMEVEQAISAYEQYAETGMQADHQVHSSALTRTPKLSSRHNQAPVTYFSKMLNSYIAAMNAYQFDASANNTITKAASLASDETASFRDPFLSMLADSITYGSSGVGEFPFSTLLQYDPNLYHKTIFVENNNHISAVNNAADPNMITESAKVANSFSMQATSALVRSGLNGARIVVTNELALGDVGFMNSGFSIIVAEPKTYLPTKDIATAVMNLKVILTTEVMPTVTRGNQSILHIEAVILTNVDSKITIRYNGGVPETYILMSCADATFNPNISTNYNKVQAMGMQTSSVIDLIDFIGAEDAGVSHMHAGEDYGNRAAVRSIDI